MLTWVINALNFSSKKRFFLLLQNLFVALEARPFNRLEKTTLRLDEEQQRLAEVASSRKWN